MPEPSETKMAYYGFTGLCNSPRIAAVPAINGGYNEIYLCSSP